MKFSVDVNTYGHDTFVTASDWRYSAAIVGLTEYLDYCHSDYSIRKIWIDELGFEDEGLLCSSADISEVNYLAFVEARCQDDLQHCQVELLLREAQPLSEEDSKRVNELLSGTASNTVMKKTLDKIKYDGTNSQEILALIDGYRAALIKETFRNKKNLYANFSNPNCLFAESGEICRLNGYYVDLPKKGKSIGYGFDKGRITSQDDIIFDFIPFAFEGGRETYFINNSASLKKLREDYQHLGQLSKQMKLTAIEDGKRLNSRRIFWAFIIDLMNARTFDLEVVVKSPDKGYFETLYVRRESADILKTLAAKTSNGKILYDTLARVYSPDGGSTYIDIQKETIEAILNLTVLDRWIDFFLKMQIRDQEAYFKILIDRWIKINIQIRNGGTVMKKNIGDTRKCAERVLEKARVLKNEKKIQTYRTKLISSLISHDYDRACQILLHLSNYSGIPFSFAYDLFEDFEANKDIAYTFINALDDDLKNAVTKEAN